MSRAGADTIPSGSVFTRWWPSLAVVGAFWVLAVNQLRVEWSINAQYAYGWIVPLLAAYLGLERWKDRPAAVPSSRTKAALVALPLIILLLPLRLVQESSPDWRFVSWAMAGACAGISLCAAYVAGGRPWLFHFFFPIAFILVAVPWPVPVEQRIVQSLMRAVTGVCVETLGWCGVPAVQNGNIIEINNAARVGIEDACSGMRSLQTTLMIALFMGDLLRLGAVRRIVLLAGGLGVAFLCNLGRAFLLVWLTARSGPAAVSRWHDGIGIATLVLSLIGVALLCALLRRAKDGPGRSAGPLATATPGRPPAAGWVIGLTFWLVFIEAGTEAWYRMHEAGLERKATWFIRWPEEKPGFRNVELSDVTRAVLRHSEGRSAVWSDADGRKWAMVFLRWNPGRSSVQLARSHGPEICLPATGAIMDSDLGLKTLVIQGIELPVHAYVFKSRSQDLHVFYCRWEQGPRDEASQSSLEEMTVERRVGAVRAGRRNAGQQVVEIAVSDVPGHAEAEAAVIRFLEGAIQRQPGSGGAG